MPGRCGTNSYSTINITFLTVMVEVCGWMVPGLALEKLTFLSRFAEMLPVLS